MADQRTVSRRSSIDEKHQAAMAMDPKNEKVYVMETDEGAQKRKRFFFWKLTKKQWIAALVCSLLLVVLAVLLIIFLAVVPAIFQNNVDKVKFTLNHLDIKSFTTEGDSNKIDVELSIHVDVDASTSSKINAATVGLFFEDKEFTTVQLPEQHLVSGINSYDLMIKNEAVITDAAVFRALSKVLITDEKVLVDARTHVKVHAKGLTYGGLKLERQLTVKGLHQFTDPMPVFNNITLSDCTESAYKLLINVTLDNESQVGIGGIGALNLTVSNDQGYLGQAITVGSDAIPRGPTPTMLELTVYKSTKTMTAFKGLISGLIALNSKIYAMGNHPYATPVKLLDEAFGQLNVTLTYTDGLKKVTLNPKCDILSLL